MLLQAGTRVGAYEVVSLLGAGGMGEVYRATDTRLGREVALKVLPEAFAADAERFARFEREAKLLAALNHSSIAHLYGFESAALERGAQIHVLVMELVEGMDLDQRLKRGPLPLDEALPIARQVAEALEEAHEKGIVHRDLKPANVKVTPDGKVKVLDFGLAKAYSAETASGPPADISQSPTLARTGTQAGLVLGTAGYMPPEQARGKAVDKRADIWAFGVVLFEMLTGRKLFDGDSVTDVLAAVVREPIRFDALRATTPSEVRRLLERCLERDPRSRLRDIGEARVLLGGPLSEMATPAPAPPPAGRRAWRSAWPWLVALVAVVAGWALGRRPAPKAAAAPVATFGVPVPAGHVLPGDETPILDLSADGRTLVFVAEGKEGRSIFRRTLDAMEPVEIEGTSGALHPFLSPDARWVGFFADGQLRKVPIEGGAPIALTPVRAYRGGTWGGDGWIVLTPGYSSGLSKVRDTGGEAQPLTRLDTADRERTHRWPAFVPGTPWVIFTVGRDTSPSFYDDAEIAAVDVRTGQRRSLFQGAMTARPDPPGRLLVQRSASLLAVPFDFAAMRATGEAESLVEGVGGERSSGAGYFAPGAGVTLAFVPGRAIPEERRLVLVGSDGRESALPLEPRPYYQPRFSPDGKRLAFAVGSGQAENDDLWLYDISSARLSRLTFSPGSGIPSWSPDGATIAYCRARDRIGIFKRAVDGSGSEIPLWTTKSVVFPETWLPDGSAVLVTDSASDIGVHLVPARGGAAVRLLEGPADEWGATVSPDGRFVAYVSTETGVDEIFVETYPPGGGKWQVSVGGGQFPVWWRDGSRIAYVRSEEILVADVVTRPAFHAGQPRVLIRGPYQLRTAPIRNFDLGPDGRFVLARRWTETPVPGQIEVRLGGPRAP